MKLCRFQRWWLLPIGLLLVPSSLWLAIVIAAPTSWARARFVGAIESASGRAVRLDRLSVCLLGGMKLSNLEIGAPGTVDDPWLRAGEVTLNLSPLSVFLGQLKPGQLDVSDVHLRVLRRKDGTLELSDLVKPAGKESGRSDGESDCCALGTCLAGTHRLKVGIHRGLVLVIDQLNETRYEIRDVEGEATLEGKSGGVLALDGRMNGGTIRLSGQFDRTMREPSFDIQVDASDVDVKRDLRGLRYLIPMLAGEQGQLEGRLAGQVSLQARGSDVDTIRKSLRGRGALRLEPVRLQGASFLDRIRKIADLPPARLSESIRSQFEIEDQRITTNSSTIQLGAIPLKFTGWTDFNGSLEYKVNLDAVTSRIPDKAIRFLREIDLEVDEVGTLQLSGTLDNLVVRIDGESLNPEIAGKPSRPGDDRDRLRTIGRKFLDKLVR